MVEVEMKFPVADFTALERKLTAWEAEGADKPKSRAEEDHYFNAPDRDFARTDEALRLRRIGDENFLTYKGPRIDAVTKTREEIEVPLASGAEAAEKFTRLLIDLGYRPVAVVCKQRRLFHFEQDQYA